jgi:predicted nuclease of predicted toxin-antitoxin system
MKIKFLLDENMPFALLEFLTNRGYDTIHLKKIEKVGIKNGEVYKVAEKDNSWIITRDSDFKNLHKFIEHNIRGILVFTVTDTRTQNILNLMKQFLEFHSEKLTSKHLIIIEDKEVKIYESK